MPKLMDLTGKVYSRLTVVKYHGRINKRSYWECVCICGKASTVSMGCLRSGNTKSCGCLKMDSLLTRSTTHGDSESKEYSAWGKIKTRCYNKNNLKYPAYGARGIRVCKRWLKSYKDFLSDMGRAPSPKHSIGRINNDGDYKPSNCRWETDKQQANNKTNNVLLTHNGETKSLQQWADQYGIGHWTLRARIKWGWPTEVALTKPLRIPENGTQTNWNKKRS